MRRDPSGSAGDFFNIVPEDEVMGVYGSAQVALPFDDERGQAALWSTVSRLTGSATSPA